MGLKVGAVPKMLDVRFRVIVNLTDWVLKDDIGVYGFIDELARKVKDGKIKELTETELLLLNKYYDNYIEFLLSASFISDIGVHIIGRVHN